MNVKVISADGEFDTVGKNLVTEFPCLNGIVSQKMAMGIFEEGVVSITLPFNVTKAALKNFFQWGQARRELRKTESEYPEKTKALKDVLFPKIEIYNQYTYEKAKKVYENYLEPCPYNKKTVEETYNFYMEHSGINELADHPDYEHLKYLYTRKIMIEIETKLLHNKIISLDDEMNYLLRCMKPLSSKHFSDERVLRLEKERVDKLWQKISEEIEEIIEKTMIGILTKKYKVDISALILAHYFDEKDFYENATLTISYENLGEHELAKLPEDLLLIVAENYLSYIYNLVDDNSVFNHYKNTERFEKFTQVSPFLANKIWESNKKLVVNKFSIINKFHKVMFKNNLINALKFLKAK
jgi:hypothetical protein